MKGRRILQGSLLLLVEFNLVSFCLPAPHQQEKATAGRIRPWPENPYYWEYKGKPVLLLGGSDEDNLFNHPLLMRRQLEQLRKIGGNYIRATLSSRDKGNRWPFQKRNGRYDLKVFDPEYWNRLDTNLREAAKRDIIVQIEVWATWDFYRDRWRENPFNPTNNSNYTTENTSLETRWPYHPAKRVQPFFFSVPEKNNDLELLRYQQAFVRKVLEISFPYANVLYCLDNETKAPQAWAHYWARFIHQEARSRGLTVQLTEMWDPWNLRAKHHQGTYAFPELFSFTDVSQNNWQNGQTHYQRLMWFRQTLALQAGGARPMNNVKVYGRRRRKEWHDPETNKDRWWQNVFAGCASTRFHRPKSGLGLNKQARKTIRAARTFLSAFDIFRSEPRPEWLTDREENEAYCLAVGTRAYALYLPRGGQIRLEASGSKESYVIRWFDPQRERFRREEPLPKSDGKLIIQSPNQKQTWLALVQ